MAVSYFLTYRYMESNGDVIDGNWVVHLDSVIEDETDIEQLEMMIAEDKGVDPSVLGLTNIVRLGE